MNDRPRQEPPIHLGANQPLPKRLDRSLRKRWLLCSQHAQDHLPVEVHHRELDGLSVRATRVPLQQSGHRHQRWRNRLLACAAVAVHRLQLELEAVVELSPSDAPAGTRIACASARAA